jgi:DNA-binding NarL/FixJ family response regulator
MIRLFIIEDHATIIVAGLKRLFYSSRDNIEILGYAESVDQAFESGEIGSADLIILDLWLTNRQPVENLRRLKKQFPGTPVIIYTSEEAFSWKHRMYKEGAEGYLTKKASRSEIRSAINLVMKGEKVFPITMDQLIEEEIAYPNEKTKLSPMQKEILKMLSKGINHKEIANTLSFSISNLEKSMKALRAQYQVKNNIELIAKLGSAEEPPIPEK